jgi:hypothetical protein
MADIPGDNPDPAAAEALLFPGAEIVGVADHAALTAPQGDIDHGAFPGHPHGQGADRIDRLLGMEPDAALAGAPGIVVLTAETAKNTDASVVHADGNAEVVFPHGLPEKVPGGSIELEKVSHSVELLLSHLKRVESLDSHSMTP